MRTLMNTVVASANCRKDRSRDRMTFSASLAETHPRRSSAFEESQRRPMAGSVPVK